MLSGRAFFFVVFIGAARQPLLPLAGELFAEGHVFFGFGVAATPSVAAPFVQFFLRFFSLAFLCLSDTPLCLWGSAGAAHRIALSRSSSPYGGNAHMPHDVALDGTARHGRARRDAAPYGI